MLLHPTSLPGEFGIGDLGPAAEQFVAFLAETGQTWWQMLPLGPIGGGNSPYQSSSSFAGNGLLISPERLVTDGLLEPGDLDDYPKDAGGRVDFEAVRAAKDRLVRRALDRLPEDHADFRAFRDQQAYWLDDYALYVALKEAHDGKVWTEWEPGVAGRDPAALERARATHLHLVRLVQFEQYLFDRQWNALRQLCRSRQIRLIGDVPIFVAHDSADVWTRPELFELDRHGRPTRVAGVPPDYFSADGQLWGNPLYRWAAHDAEGYAWWASRLRGVLSRVDLVRLDHFRGFEAYWSVPAAADTAAAGRWIPGPGARFLESMRAALGGLRLIAEDLGEITPDVEELRDDFGLPGMRVLQFAFNLDGVSDIYLPHTYVPNCVVYTGTHDNDTTLGWYRAQKQALAERAAQGLSNVDELARFLGQEPGDDVGWALARVAYESVADTAVLPLQDLLGLGSEARMNVPGHAEGNWGWRFRGGELDREVYDRLRELTATYRRWNAEAPPGRDTP